MPADRQAMMLAMAHVVVPGCGSGGWVPEAAGLLGYRHGAGRARSSSTASQGQQQGHASGAALGSQQQVSAVAAAAGESQQQVSAVAAAAGVSQQDAGGAAGIARDAASSAFRVEVISLLDPLEEFVYCCHELGGGPVLLLPAGQAREVVAALDTALEQLAALLVLRAAEARALQALQELQD